MYKHFTHEGGICTPMIAHWPKGIGRPNRWIREPAHVMDIMPTLLEVTGASYPTTFCGNQITPLEGISLLPAMRGQSLPERVLGFEHQGARALRQGDWKLVWSKRMPFEIRWELYNLAEDRCEINDLAAKYPERVQAMAAEWERWARRVNVIYEPSADTAEPIKETRANSPQIANRSLRIRGHVVSDSGKGVIVAQGGREYGYAIHLLAGKLAFDVRIAGEVTRIVSEKTLPQEFDFEAQLTPDSMVIHVNGEIVAQGKSPGLIPVQPKDGMDVGHDSQTAAGDYEPPNRLDGTVRDVRVQTEEVPRESR